jgi:hypothetical protein
MTTDEIIGIGLLASMLINGEGRARLLEKIPISEEYVKLLQGVTKKLDMKLEELDEQTKRQ